MGSVAGNPLRDTKVHGQEGETTTLEPTMPRKREREKERERASDRGPEREKKGEGEREIQRRRVPTRPE